ncbi:hypothetical protein TCE0_018f05708 [Talaromyces pinophilus]|uniref:SnoaL-like domain-containing protein n=1 Tax=Talaromyces pinophilus TaxID=128442 RepID=A0A510NWV0_TALPI|nr:hypothetical protein TCE0_018f05708 [Talaromyces pinophilus]
MTIKQDTTDIIAVAEKFIQSYVAVLTTASFKNSSERAAKMATYYLPAVVSLVNGSITEISGPSDFEKIIRAALDRLGDLPEVAGYKVDAVSENSAIIWLSLSTKGMEMSNVYFFRRMEDGARGFEGGIFDGEVWLLSQLGKL